MMDVMAIKHEVDVGVELRQLQRKKKENNHSFGSHK
jgi:hypothetical protein